MKRAPRWRALAALGVLVCAAAAAAPAPAGVPVPVEYRKLPNGL